LFSHSYICDICRSYERGLIFQTLVYNPNICGSCSLIGQHKKQKKNKNEQQGPHLKIGVNSGAREG